MKKIILFTLIGIMMVSIVSSQVQLIGKEPINKQTLIKDLTKKESDILVNNYKDKIKGITGVKNVKIKGHHVAISFDGSSYRVFTSKERYYKLIKSIK
jgi:hypothetical protein